MVQEFAEATYTPVASAIIRLIPKHIATLIVSLIGI